MSGKTRIRREPTCPRWRDRLAGVTDPDGRALAPDEFARVIALLYRPKSMEWAEALSLAGLAVTIAAREFTPARASLFTFAVTVFRTECIKAAEAANRERRRPAKAVLSLTPVEGDPAGPLDPVDPRPTPAEEIEAREARSDTAAVVAAILSQISPMHREALALRFGIGCDPHTPSEMAPKLTRVRSHAGAAGSGLSRQAATFRLDGAMRAARAVVAAQMAAGVAPCE